MYLAEAGKWADVREVVGISGGSFAVAALSSQLSDNQSGQESTAGKDDPTAALRELLAGLERAARLVRWIIGRAIIVLALIAGLLVVAFRSAFYDHTFGLLAVSGISLLFTSLIIRLVFSVRWRSIVRRVFPDAQMRQRGPAGRADESSDGTRRYAIGTTGLSDGQLYSFSSDRQGDLERWRNDPLMAIPLEPLSLATIVARATSLPGLGQLGFESLYMPSCDHPGSGHGASCERVPDRLVDGGISGIFGRGLVTPRTEPPQIDRPAFVVVDAGRKLNRNNGSSSRHRLSRLLERLLAVVLLSRWLIVALDIAYRSELKQVADGSVEDGYEFRLVRLAEEEELPLRDDMTVARAAMLNRLYALRDKAHELSLLGVSRKSANRAMTVAVAACALEFEPEPDMKLILDRIGQRLGRGMELTDAWTGVYAPLLGEPAELGPP
jgi:hypothetical protein